MSQDGYDLGVGQAEVAACEAKRVVVTKFLDEIKMQTATLKTMPITDHSVCLEFAHARFTGGCVTWRLLPPCPSPRPDLRSRPAAPTRGANALRKGRAAALPQVALPAAPACANGKACLYETVSRCCPRA